MSHVRSQLRTHTVDALKGGDVEDVNIHNSKVTPFKPGDHFNVLTPFDEAQNPGRNYQTYIGAVDLQVQVLTKAVDGFADRLDQLCAFVQKELENREFGDAILIEHLESTATDFDDEGNATHAIAEMNFKASYQIDKADPETAIL